MITPLGEPTMSMRWLTATAVFLLFAPLATLTAQGDPDRAGAGGGNFPAGWHVRTETNPQTRQPAAPPNVKFTHKGDRPPTPGGPARVYLRVPRPHPPP